MNTIPSTSNTPIRPQETESTRTEKPKSVVPPDSEPTRLMEDSVELSDQIPVSDKEEKKGVGNGFADFDMDAFQAEMRNQLLDMVKEAKKAAKDAGIEFDAKWSADKLLYEVSEETEAAEVPEYWNAENTSQRIVDFAMSFRSLAPELTDDDYIQQVREAVVAGFRESKDMLGDLPGSVGKLFNDTYNLTMKKFDELMRKNETPEEQTTQNT